MVLLCACSSQEVKTLSWSRGSDECQKSTEILSNLYAHSRKLTTTTASFWSWLGSFSRNCCLHDQTCICPWKNICWCEYVMQGSHQLWKQNRLSVGLISFYQNHSTHKTSHFNCRAACFFDLILNQATAWVSGTVFITGSLLANTDLILYSKLNAKVEVVRALDPNLVAGEVETSGKNSLQGLACGVWNVNRDHYLYQRPDLCCLYRKIG